MSQVLTREEKEILLKVFEGNFPPFETLSKQINSLCVKRRRKLYHTYDVWFEVMGKGILPLQGVEEHMQIEGTLLFINESDATLYVSVKVIDGYIHWLVIGGDYNFENDFTIRKVVWENRNDDPKKKGEIVVSAKDREFRKAISYIPMYR